MNGIWVLCDDYSICSFDYQKKKKNHWHISVIGLIALEIGKTHHTSWPLYDTACLSGWALLDSFELIHIYTLYQPLPPCK